MRAAPYLLAAAIASAALPASAEVFKCQQPGGQTIYQDRPCAGSPNQTAIELQVHRPTRAEHLTTQQRAAEEARFVREAEVMRERERRQAAGARAATKPEDLSRPEKCAEYQRRADYLESSVVADYRQRFRVEDAADARKLRDRYFAECLGRREAVTRSLRLPNSQSE